MHTDRLPPSIEERLKARADSTGRSLAAVAREAVLDQIDALESYVVSAGQKRRQLARESDPPPSTAR